MESIGIGNVKVNKNSQFLFTQHKKLISQVNPIYTVEHNSIKL